jgi:hypothetical protein
MSGPTVVPVLAATEDPTLDAAELAYDRAVAAFVATLPALKRRIAAIEHIRDAWAAYRLARGIPDETTTEEAP